MNKQRHLGFALNTIAIFLFFPGIILPMFSLNMSIAANVGTSDLTSSLIDKNLSLINTITELWQDQRFMVAILICAFSIVIPITKSLLVSFAYFKRNTLLERKLINFVASIGKWSMADVFVVAIFLAVLSTNHAETINTQQFSVFGFKFEFLISSETLSAVGHGFYFFTAYCLLSLLGSHLSQRSLKTSQKESLDGPITA